MVGGPWGGPTHLHWRRGGAGQVVQRGAGGGFGVRGGNGGNHHGNVFLAHNHNQHDSSDSDSGTEDPLQVRKRRGVGSTHRVR